MKPLQRVLARRWRRAPPSPPNRNRAIDPSSRTNRCECSVELAPGRFEFLSQPITFSLKNPGESKVEIYEFELK